MCLRSSFVREYWEDCKTKACYAHICMPKEAVREALYAAVRRNITADVEKAVRALDRVLSEYRNW